MFFAFHTQLSPFIHLLADGTDLDRKWNQRCLCSCSCQLAAAAGVASAAGLSPTDASPEAVVLPGVGLGSTGEAEEERQSLLPEIPLLIHSNS